MINKTWPATLEGRIRLFLLLADEVFAIAENETMKAELKHELVFSHQASEKISKLFSLDWQPIGESYKDDVQSYADCVRSLRDSLLTIQEAPWGKD